jgi:hypothetical protein
MLNDGGGRCCDLAERSGKSQAYVHRYLRNLRKYGLVIQNDAFWFLTPKGAEFVKYLDFVYNNILYYRQKEDRKKTEERQKEDTSQPKTLKQIPITLWLAKSDLSETEKEVVDILVKHYNETGSKFILIKDQYEFAEKIKSPPQDILPALKNLRQDNIIYLHKSEIPGYWKIGLKKAFLEARMREQT